MSNDKLAEALREVLTDINLVKCHWCKCHTWCSVEDACKTLAEHEAHAAEAAQAQAQAAKPVAVIESAEDRHGPYLTHANVVLRVWNGYVPKAGDEIYTRPQPAQDAECPYVITSGEGTSHCRLAEQDTKDAARYRWLRDSADSYTWDYLGGIGADRVDAAVDAAMAKESGNE